MTRPQHYILKGHIPVPVFDLMEWALWFESADRVVKRTVIEERLISTVFIGLDHNFDGTKDPLLFETMVFGVKDDKDFLVELDGYMLRYTTWSEAEHGHDDVVQMLMEAIAQRDKGIVEADKLLSNITGKPK